MRPAGSRAACWGPPFDPQEGTTRSPSPQPRPFEVGAGWGTYPIPIDLSDKHYPTVESFLTDFDPWLIYMAVFALTFGESAAFLSLVFPGEVGLVSAAAVGVVVGVDPFLLASVATLGAFSGGQVGFWMGGRYGSRLIKWRPIERRLGARMEELMPLLVGAEAAALVAVARFNQITRAVVPALAGMAEMRRARFVAANGLGALLWAAVFTAVGFYAAESWHAASGWVQLVMVVVVVAGAGFWLTRRWRRRRVL